MILSIASEARGMSAKPILALLLGSVLATPAADPLGRVLNGPADDAAIYKPVEP